MYKKIDSSDNLPSLIVEPELKNVQRNDQERLDYYKNLDQYNYKRKELLVENHEKTNVYGSIWNFTNIILGITLLNYPYIYKETGVIVGFILTICAALIGRYTYNICIDTSALYIRQRKIKIIDASYEKITALILGKKWSIILTISIFLVFWFNGCLFYCYIRSIRINTQLF